LNYLLYQSFSFALCFFTRRRLAGKLSLLASVIFLGLNYPAGNDFVGYFTNYDCIVNNICKQSIGDFELGFNAINFVLGGLGYQVMIFFIAAFNIFCVYKFSSYFNNQAFVFLTVIGVVAWPLYTEALRQSLSISMVILSIPYLMKKRVIKFSIFIVLGALFHTGALVCLIFLSTFLNNVFARIITIVIFVLSLLFFILPVKTLELILLLLPSSSMAYEKLMFYASSEVYQPQLSIGFGVIPDFFLVIVLLYLMSKGRSQLNISWVSQGVMLFIAFFVIIGRGMPVFTRLGWYGIPFVATLLSTVFEGGVFLNRIKVNHIFIIKGIIFLWILSQILRPFVYSHSAYGILQQELIFFRLADLNDQSLAWVAAEKCKTLHFLGYPELCTLE